MKKKNTLPISNTLLIIAAFIWGSNYIFQKIVATEIGPFTFMGMRSFIGSLTILIIILFINRKKTEDSTPSVQKNNYSLKSPAYLKRIIRVSIMCGCINVTGSVLVQWGLQYTNASKASFLNAIYIIFVPILGMIFFRKSTSKNVWIGVFLATIGLYFLCATNGLHIQTGDILILLSTLFFAFHILLVSKYVHEFKGIHLAWLEFFFASIYCSIMAFILEHPALQQVESCSYSILYAGILGIGVCYALQYTAQKHTDPTVAALLMSLEAVFGCIGGVIILGESFSLRELIGVSFIVVSIILAQLPSVSPSKKNTDA